MAADIFNCPITLPEVEEAAAFGAALQALWMKQAEDSTPVSMSAITEAHGRMSGKTVMPESKAADAYDTAYNKYIDSLNLLTPHFMRTQ